MSYDLEIWEGEQPCCATNLRKTLDAMSDASEQRYLRGEASELPSPKIKDFVEALLRRWPDCGEDASPWSSAGTGHAEGSSLHINIQWGRQDEVSTFVAGLAKVHGLNCYDPQQNRLRP
ncbi:hypothetical protein [Nocardia goodfellowii]|uniref:Uncharacterized protein n=1 Tax=Nocardia goodfellowii TaxID=882446 RepID=A0ABS4QPR2_9NOCA|nr:hypothetical protein [Nocardia goodfellowii]MBP2193014.1 hypothetical protein [Nocardia goodfellowii]